MLPRWHRDPFPHAARSIPLKYEPRLHIVLHEPEIPQNTGNIGRTCLAIEAKLWLVRPLGFTIDDYYLRRAGLDYWDELEWEAVDHWGAICGRLDPERMWFFSAHAARSYLTAAFQRGDVMVFGKESAGLPAPIMDRAPDRKLTFPMNPKTRSLNLSNCVAIAGYEAMRQMNLHPAS